MKKTTQAIIVLVAMSAISGTAFAQNYTAGYQAGGDVVVGAIEGPDGGAALLGGSNVAVYVPRVGEQTAQTVDAIEVNGLAAAPMEGELIDMSGVDGKLAACYANGGIVKQGQDFRDRCTYDKASTAGPVAADSDFVAAPDVETGYNGTTNPQDEALMDCLARGGSLIQLAANNQFACAM